MKNKIVLVLTVWITSCIVVPSLSAGTISVTKVSREGDTATIVINDVIEIRDILISGNDIGLPSYTSKSGKINPQVKFMTEEAFEVVRSAVVNNTKSAEKSRSITYKVSKLNPFEKAGSSMLAFATVLFNGVMEIECKIMKSSSGYDEWVAWPARAPDRNKGEKRWQDQVRIINNKVKSIVEKDIVETYGRAGPSSRGMTTEDVYVKEGTVDSPLSVTAVNIKDVSGEAGLVAKASVDLNHSFRINGIKVFKRLGQIFLELPVYVSKSGREYEQVKILSGKLRTKIKNALKSREPSKNKYNKIGFQIGRFERNRWEGATKYNCSVIINGEIEVSCKIKSGEKYKPFVAWPSVREDETYVDQVKPVNPEVKRVIENILLSKYYKEQKEGQ